MLPFTSVNLSTKLKLVALPQLRKLTEHAKPPNLEPYQCAFVFSAPVNALLRGEQCNTEAAAYHLKH